MSAVIGTIEFDVLLQRKGSDVQNAVGTVTIPIEAELKITDEDRANAAPDAVSRFVLPPGALVAALRQAADELERE